MIAYSLLLDIGGTDFKIASSKNGELDEGSVKRMSLPSLVINARGQAVLRPRQILQMVQKAVFEYILESGTPDRIMISGQMGSWILTESNGEPATDVISWQDTSYATTAALKLSEVFHDVYDSSSDSLIGNGAEDWPGAPWRGVATECLKIQEGDKRLFHTLSSWIGWELTNRKNHAIHVTDAAASGLVRIPDLEWIEIYSEYANRIIMPKLLKSTSELGTLEGTSIPLFAAVGDQQASLLGAGLDLETCVLNAGTGGQVVKLISSSKDCTNKVRPYFENVFFETVTHIPSGRFVSKFLEECNEFFGTEHSWDWVWKDNQVYDLTNLEGITTWKFDSFLDNFFMDKGSAESAKRVFLRGLGENFIGALIKLELGATKRIILAGGVAQSWAPMEQLILTKVGIPAFRSPSIETTLNGLSKLSTQVLIR